MNSTTTQTKIKPKRTMRWLRHDGPGKGILEIVMNADKKSARTFLYQIAPVPGVDFGPAYAMGKVNDRCVIEEVYHLTLADGGSCECMGHLRHGHCKHLDAVKHLTAIGRI